MPRVADTPAVDPMPTTAAGPGYTTPTFRTNDYIPEIVRGQKLVSEGLRAQEEKDREAAKTKIQDAVNMYASRASSFLVEDGGPLQMKQKQVMGKDDGRTFFVKASADLGKIADQYVPEFGMTAEEEQEYRRRLVPLNKGYWSQLNDHYANQKLAYELDVQGVRVDRAKLNIAQGGNVTANLAVIRDGVKRAMNLKGQVIDNKYVNHLTQLAAEQGVSEYIKFLIDNNRQADASTYLQLATTQGAITPEFAFEQRQTVETALAARAAKDGASNAYAELKELYSPVGRAQTALRANGGVNPEWGRAMAVSQGVKDWDQLDDRRKRSYERDAIASAMTQYGGDTTLAFVSLIVGSRGGMSQEKTKEWMDENLALAAKDGNPAGIVGYLEPPEKAALTRALNTYNAAMNRDFAPTDAEIMAEVKRVRPFATEGEIADTVKQTKELIKAQLAYSRTEWDATVSSVNSALLNGASQADIVTTPGYSKLPPSYKNRLSKMVERKLSGAFDVVGDSALFVDLNNNPTELSLLSDGRFELLASELNAQQKQILRDQRDAMKAGVKMTGKWDSAQATEIIKENWGQLGQTEDWNSADGKKRTAELLQLVAPDLRARSLQKGENVSYTEMKDIILARLNTPLAKKAGWFDDGITALGSLTAVSDDARRLLADALGVRDADALKGFEGVKALRAVTDITVPVSAAKVPLPIRARIVDAYKGATGVTPDDRTIVFLAACMYQKDSLSLTKLMGKEGAKLLTERPSVGIMDYIEGVPALGRITGGSGFDIVDETPGLSGSSGGSQSNGFDYGSDR